MLGAGDPAGDPSRSSQTARDDAPFSSTAKGHSGAVALEEPLTHLQSRKAFLSGQTGAGT